MNLAITRAEELGIYKPGVKKAPSELYIPYNSTVSATSSMDDDDYMPTPVKATEQSQKVVEEMEHVVAQLDLGSNTITPL